VAPATAQDLVHGGTSVRAQVKTIAYLDRVRRTLPASFGIGASTIADNDLDAGVAAQPGGEDLGGAIVEQVDRPMRFEIE
jgi:hypothetical protein